MYVVNDPSNLERDWLGLGIAPEETRHGKLQRHCHLAAELLPLHAASAVLHNWYHRAPLYHGADSQHPTAQEGYRQVL